MTSTSELNLQLDAIDNTQLDERDDWNDVCQAVSVLNAKWRTLAINLGLHASLIDEIAHDNPSSVANCLSQALKHWLQCNFNQTRYGGPSWRTLAMAVKPLNGRLFNIIKDTHPAEGHPLVSTDSRGINQPRPVLTNQRHQHDTRQPASHEYRRNGMGLPGALVVVAVAVIVSLGLTSYYMYTDHNVIVSDHMSQRGGGGDKVSFRSFPHMNERPTMNQLNTLERGDGGTPVRITERIGAKNPEIGTYLLKDDQGVIMTTITENAWGDTQAINREIFRRWLAGSGAPVSWKVLVEALEVAQLKALANDVIDALHT